MSLDLLYPVFLGPTPVKASGRASPSTCNRFPKGRWGKVALLKGYEKFPKLQFRPLGLEGKLSSGRKSCHRCQGPSLTAPAARDPPPRGVSASAAAARASLRLVPRGRLRLPLSPAARGEVTPLNVSAARGGAGKWLPVCTLRSSSSSTASPPPPGAAVPGDGVARVRAARREGVTARGGGGSRARLGAERVDALREVPVLGAATARDGGRGEAAKATPKLQVLLEKSGLKFPAGGRKGPQSLISHWLLLCLAHMGAAPRVWSGGTRSSEC